MMRSKRQNVMSTTHISTALYATLMLSFVVWKAPIQVQASSNDIVFDVDSMDRFNEEKACPTRRPELVVFEKTSGNYFTLEEWELKQETEDDDIHIRRDESIREKVEHLQKSMNDDRRYLRQQYSLDFLPYDAAMEDVTYLTSTTSATFLDASHTGRSLSTNGSDSISTPTSREGNVDTYSSSDLFILRRCSCAQDVMGKDAFCPEASHYCGLLSGVTEEGKPTIGVECYSMSRKEVVSLNAWPLIWLLYAMIISSICCTFQGRIIMDFVKGTILYYVCGCGDRLRNRQLRSIARYNNSIVNEILEEERMDRENVRRRRNRRTRTGRQMDSIVNNSDSVQIPPTITTSPTGGQTDMDADISHVEMASSDGEDGGNYFTNWFQNFVWPWQTSWDRYIKYNLMLRVEWIAIRDEVAFIESRQERGLPHAQYEMKTRYWKSDDEADQQQQHSCSSLNSLDAPHCTICFMELEEGDRVGELGCVHVFHADCLKMWVQKRNSCPLCNIPIARRRRISSEELVKTSDPVETVDLDRRTNDRTAGTSSEANDASGGSTTDQHDHTISIGSITHEPLDRSGHASTRRLTHMPMTPSTIAADTYSSYSEEMESSSGDEARSASYPYSSGEQTNDDEFYIGSHSDHTMDPELPSPPRVRQLRRHSYETNEGASAGLFDPNTMETSANGNNAMEPPMPPDQD